MHKGAPISHTQPTVLDRPHNPIVTHFIPIPPENKAQHYHLTIQCISLKFLPPRVSLVDSQTTVDAAVHSGRKVMIGPLIGNNGLNKNLGPPLASQSTQEEGTAARLCCSVRRSCERGEAPLESVAAGARFDRLSSAPVGSEETSSRLGLIGPKDVSLMKKSSKLGLIGLKGFDFDHLVTYSAWFDRLRRLKSDQKRHPRDSLGLIGFVGSNRIRRGILETRCVTQLFFGRTVGGRDCSSTRQSLEQLRDATVEMRGAAVELHGASVLRTPNFKQLRNAAVEWRGVGVEVDLGKARSSGSATDASTFWDLLDPPMRARVIAAGFGDYAAGLRRTQPLFPPAMRYALMERWNDCTHTFVFGFGKMTLTPVDYAAITGLRFTGPVPPLDARYQTATLGAQLVHSLLGVTTQTRYTAQGCVSYEVVFWF
ncbi:hypothetical protein JCGZ_26567 [Jatropha curcas]|uniref:Aminotransferase-like plant mobile domain-containing protein n=1 Tax=Jatropha curcas TaxID=180498 RepID=A0A067JKR4_JATCU|nr:hypothetical protein JCGZ_26567 [Jatropha curcas]